VWRPWTVDLSGPERWARLELRASSVAPVDWTTRTWGEPAVWGDPRLVWDPRGIEAGIRLSEDGFDSNQDGIATRDEIHWTLLAFDSDGDGALSDAEAAAAGREVADVLASIPAQAPGRVTSDEIDAWIAEFWAL
jgi:hypothetical protein